jgi:hypothetical protein
MYSKGTEMWGRQGNDPLETSGDPDDRGGITVRVSGPPPRGIRRSSQVAVRGAATDRVTLASTNGLDREKFHADE